MPRVFSCGPLQQEDVQRSTFGRLLQGEKDEVPGFEQAPAMAADGKAQQANVTFNGRDDSRVAGTVFAKPMSR